MSRRKQSTRPTDANTSRPPVSRVGNLALLGALGLGLFGLAFSGLTANNESPTRTPRRHHDEPTASEQAEDVIADAERARQMRQHMIEVIEPFAARDPEIAMLRDFYVRQAIPAAGLTGHLFIPPSPELITDEMVEDQIFFFVVTDSNRLRELGFQVVSPYEFTEDRQLRFATGITTEQLEISAFIHELRHAYDRCTGLEPTTEAFNDIWIEGELRAYHLQIRVLDMQTEGRFSALAEAFATRAEVPANRLAIPTVTSREAEALEAMMGPYIGEIDLQYRTGALLLAANFARIANLGLTHADEIEMFREIQRASFEMVGADLGRP